MNDNIEKILPYSLQFVDDNQTVKKINYIKEKKGKVDVCNICGKVDNLTWDHVPPKGVGNNSVVDTNTLFEGVPLEGKYQKRFQNGIKYRTVCGNCNNGLLGKYDIAYKNFVRQIEGVLMTDAYSKDKVSISIEINKVCKAICGHFLAAKNDYDQCLVDVDLRQYVQYEAELVNESYGLYYWIYPYETINIARDFVAKSITKSFFPNSMISIIAAFPIAFMLTSEKEPQCGLDDLFNKTSANIDDIVDIKVDRRSMCYPNTNILRHYLWPCNVADDEYSADFTLGARAYKEDSRAGIKRIDL